MPTFLRAGQGDGGGVSIMNHHEGAAASKVTIYSTALHVVRDLAAGGLDLTRPPKTMKKVRSTLAHIEDRVVPGLTELASSEAHRLTGLRTEVRARLTESSTVNEIQEVIEASQRTWGTIERCSSFLYGVRDAFIG